MAFIQRVFSTTHVSLQKRKKKFRYGTTPKFFFSVSLTLEKLKNYHYIQDGIYDKKISLSTRGEKNLLMWRAHMSWAEFISRPFNPQDTQKNSLHFYKTRQSTDKIIIIKYSRILREFIIFPRFFFFFLSF